MQAQLALLVLEDGRIFRGKAFGAKTEAAGEVVFNTSLLCRADCGSHQSPHRKLRHDAERRRIGTAND